MALVVSAAVASNVFLMKLINSLIKQGPTQRNSNKMRKWVTRGNSSALRDGERYIAELRASFR